MIKVKWLTELRFQLDKGNLPLRKPGIYALFNTVTGFWYVGMAKDVLWRLTEHSDLIPHVSGPKLFNALKKYGPPTFKALPLFYLLGEIVDRKFLAEVESSLIEVYNSIENGYNINQHSEGTGQYGAEFVARCKQARGTLESREKSRTVAIKQFSTPEGREKHRKGIIKALADSDTREKHLAAIYRIAKDSDVNARRRVTLRNLKRGCICITDGKVNKVLLGNKGKVPLIPEGWRRGRTSSKKMQKDFGKSKG